MQIIKSGKQGFGGRAFALVVTVIVMQLVFAAGAFAVQGRISEQSVDLLTRTGKAMAEISGAVKPAIVNIATSRTVKVQGGAEMFDDPFFRRFFGDNFNRQKQPRERKASGLGSGVIVSTDGYIVTNFHVVKDADEIKVTLSDKREFNGKVVGSDPKTEISIVKIEAKGLPTLPWGDSDRLQVGEIVLAVGSPYGLNQTVTMGIVSAIGRANVGIADYEDFIQTDAAINPGNSGGAMVNVRGELVGINTAIYSTSGGYQGIGFAIPSNMIKTIMDSLVRKGKVVRGWLGVSIQKVTPELSKQFNVKDEAGVLISDTFENGPADKAGLRRGDVIIEYDGRKVDEPYQIRNMVAGNAPGEEHALKVLREGQPLVVKVIVGELPGDLKAEPGDYQNVFRGIGVQDINPELSRKMNIPARIKGVIITDLDENSPASAILMQGDVVQEINKKRIGSVREYQEVVSRIAKDEDVLMLIFRNGASVFITLSNK
ncbi:MAG: DegQ family serine endoprotease [Nitrospirae bacterium]|nr:MAG: DegQ family serine endoprotease [Nitrospirota bacterium]